jgi:hypothetical protein
MARIRTIKPEFWAHEDLSSLPESTHILAAALLNYADDEGYFNANPALVLAACSPLREPSVSIPESLRSLQTIGYIKLGTCPKGRRYGQVVNFSTHQRVSHPSKSKVADISIAWDDSGNPPETLQNPPETLRPEQGTGKGTGNREQGTGKGSSGAPAPVLVSLFSEFWEKWPQGFGDKGSRKNAEAVFLKLKPDRPLVDRMIEAAQDQWQAKHNNSLSGVFVSNFKHVERWLKGREWESVVESTPRNSILDNAQDRTWAEGM